MQQQRRTESQRTAQAARAPAPQELATRGNAAAAADLELQAAFLSA